MEFVVSGCYYREMQFVFIVYSYNWCFGYFGINLFSLKVRGLQIVN